VPSRLALHACRHQQNNVNARSASRSPARLQGSERPRTLEASLQQMQRMQQERRRGAGGGAGQEMTGLSGEV